MREAFEFVFFEGTQLPKKRLTLFMINAHFLCFYFIFYDHFQIQTNTDGWRRYLVRNFLLEFPRLAMPQNSTTFRKSV